MQMKYSNFVSIDNDMTLNNFRVEISAGEFDISNQPLVFHTELIVDDYINPESVALIAGKYIRPNNLDDIKVF